MPKMKNLLPFSSKSAFAGHKPYTVDISNDGLNAEVNLYGEIVETHPIDWWTGEKVDGLFIALDEFLETLDYLGGMSSIRFNINSIGGSVDAGIAIFNKIIELANNGIEVTTRVEGAADSAASIVMQAGTRREVAIGAEVMVHCASCLILGYYNSKELDGVKQMLDAADDRIADLLADRTGKNAQEVKRMMQKTTWMTAREAVENGFADEVVNQKVTVEAINGLKNGYRINGIPHVFRNGLPAQWNTSDESSDTFANVLRKITNRLGDTDKTADAMPDEKSGESAKEVTNGDPPSGINNSQEVKQMTLQELNTQYPELIKEIKDTATADAKAAIDETVKNAVEAERQRIKDIEGIENSIADKSMVSDAKYGNPIDARTLAFNAMQMQAKAGTDYLQQREEELKGSTVTPTPNSGYETGNRAKDVADGAALIAGTGN